MQSGGRVRLESSAFVVFDSLTLHSVCTGVNDDTWRRRVVMGELFSASLGIGFASATDDVQ